MPDRTPNAAPDQKVPANPAESNPSQVLSAVLARRLPIRVQLVLDAPLTVNADLDVAAIRTPIRAGADGTGKVRGNLRRQARKGSLRSANPALPTMPKPADRPNQRPLSSETRSKKPAFIDLAAATFNVPAAAADLEDGFYVVEATALRDRLEPVMMPTSKDVTDQAPDMGPSSVPEAAEAPATEASEASTLYRWNSRQDSTLKGPRRSELWDVVTNYRDGDEIDAPEGITTTEISKDDVIGSVRKLNAGQINSKGVGAEAFEPNTARAFLYAGPNAELRNGMFVVFNDNTPGYQQKKDGLIFLEGFSFEHEADPNSVVPEAAGDDRKIVFWQDSMMTTPPSVDTAGI